MNETIECGAKRHPRICGIERSSLPRFFGEIPPLRELND